MDLASLLTSRRQFLGLEGVTIRVESEQLDARLSFLEYEAKQNVDVHVQKVAEGFKVVGINAEMPTKPTTGEEAIKYAEAVRAIAVEHYKDRDASKPTETDEKGITLMRSGTEEIGKLFDRLEELGVSKMRKHFDQIDFPVYFTIDEAEALGII